jgi:hypothetical protein
MELIHEKQRVPYPASARPIREGGPMSGTSVRRTLLNLILPCILLGNLPLVIRAGAGAERESLSLAGQWRFQVDPDTKGEGEKWFQTELAQTTWLPGSMVENGLGDEVTVETRWTGSIVDRSWFTDPKYAEYRKPGNVKVPFWLTPVKHYIGPAWYQREFVIPQAWAGKRVTLSLERCHWETKVWLDGQYVGLRNSLSTPHEYDLGLVKPGTHQLSICVDNTVKIGVGPDAHSVSDHTQGNWNGIIGAIELRATDAIRIDDVQVYPNVGRKTAKVRVTIANAAKGVAKGTLRWAATSCNSARQHMVPQATMEFTVAENEKTVELDYALGEDMLLWDEFAPNLYRLTVSLDGQAFSDSKTVVFGMRQIGTDGTQFTINGRKTFLRGTLECCIFPLTGHPPTDVEAWRKVLRAAKAHGLNHLRFHSWCPPEAAFAAADEMGMMYHIECAAWVNSGPTIGDGRPIDQFLYDESDRILRAYGNHPSFCLLAYGNEPAGKNQAQWLGDLVTYWKKKDSRRLYTSAAGWPIIPQSDYHSTPAPRGHQWGAGLKSRFNAQELTTNVDYRDIIGKYSVPVVSHEIGQWCVYPNFDEIGKYTGVLKPKNFEIFRDSLAQHHMLDQARDFLMASGKLQALLYKEEIEAALRTAGFGGFQLLDLHDFPGQGTALVGILDPFWESKGYITPEEHRRYCCETVPLLRMDKCVWTTDGKFTGTVEIAHFGPAPLKDSVLAWRVRVAGGSKVLTRGELPVAEIPIGNGTPCGRIEFALADIPAPAQLEITVAVRGTKYSNHWDIWVYPATRQTPTASDITIADRLSDEVVATLEKGGKVLLMPPLEAVRSDVPAGFTTIFWNTQWTNRQPPHTLGILCDPKHPALAQFPTEFHSNWQWWDLVTKSRFMLLDEMTPELRPIVQVIDDWNTNRKLGLVFEARVETGKLLMCSIDLRSDLNHRPVARQMLHSLLRYAGSPAFDPKASCSVEQLKGLFQ